MIKGIIFDHDGVIIDSNAIIYKNWSSVFKKQFNVNLTKKDLGMNLGRTSNGFSKALIEKYKLNTTDEEIWKPVMKNYEILKKDVQLKAHIKEVLPKLKSQYKLAVASGGISRWVKEFLTRFEIIDYFDFIIGGDQVKESKPSPEIFLKAAENLNLKPDECIVIEDALLGLQAAKAAGMKCIMIEDEFTKYQDHSQADFKISSHSELINAIKVIENGHQ